MTWLVLLVWIVAVALAVIYIRKSCRLGLREPDEHRRRRPF